jgi:hypothetical protein
MDDPRLGQRARRDALFLKGPIKFGWIRQNIPDPTSRLILVARGFMNMANPAKTEYALSLKVWDCAGIHSPDQRTRVLKKISQKCEGYWVAQRKGRTSVLHIGQNPNKITPP